MEEEILIQIENISTEDIQLRYHQLYDFLLESRDIGEIRLQEQATQEGEMGGGVIEAIVVSLIAAVIYDSSKEAIHLVLKRIKTWRQAHSDYETTIVITRTKNKIEIASKNSLTDDEIIAFSNALVETS